MDAILVSVGTWLGNKLLDKGFDSLYSQITIRDSVNKPFYDAVDRTSHILQAKHPTALGGSTAYFFQNEKVFNELFKLLFHDSNIDEDILKDSFDNTLPHDFIKDYVITLRSEVSKDTLLNNILINKEIFILLYGINTDIKIIARNSQLSLAEITELKKFLKGKLGASFNYGNFLKTYYKTAVNNLSQVNFIGLGVDLAIKRKRKNLQDVFVKPYFSLTNPIYIDKVVENEHIYHEEELEISYTDLFKYSNNVVVLGNPGSGKSVLIKSIICDIIENENISEQIFPIRIELRKYLSFKKTHTGNILKYIAEILDTEYAIPHITTDILNEIFSIHKCNVFFDGLDEIFKIEDKIDIKNDIENFHHLYPNIKSITTSRIIGYDEAKLREETFCELTVLNFNEEQIKEYLQKWYAKEEDNNEIRTKEIDGFLSKMHEIDNELVSNPLLLSLIVILYRNILKLPESKLEIYQSCTKTLVDKWDASKDLDIDIATDVYKNKEKILADLAYWQYEQLSSEEVSLSYDKAKNTVAKSISEKIDSQDDFDCDNLAESFMEYAQKRSIYFDNNFTHKTFLEYYTAYWIYSNIEKKHKITERNRIVSTYISNSFWHIVLELLLNMIDKDQADSEIMDDLIKHQIEGKIEALPFLLSTITSFKNISSKLILHTIDISLNELVIEAGREDRDFKDDYRDSILYQIYEGIKRLYFNDSIGSKHIIQRIIELENKNESNLKYFYGLHLEMELFNPLGRNRQFNLSKPELYNSIINYDRLLFFLTIHLKFDTKNNLQNLINFINNFGIDELYYHNISYFERLHLGTYIGFYINYQIASDNVKSIENDLALVESHGLSKIMVYEYLKERELYFIPRSILNNIIAKLESGNLELIIKKILLIFIAKSSSPDYERMMLEGNTLSESVRKIYNIQNRLERIPLIESMTE